MRREVALGIEAFILLHHVDALQVRASRRPISPAAVPGNPTNVSLNDLFVRTSAE